MTSKKKKEAMLAWMHSTPMWAASNALHNLGWAYIEPHNAVYNWRRAQDDLEPGKGEPPCT